MKLHKLQGLRGIAALMVVIDHSLTVIVGHPYAEHPLRDTAWFLGEQGVAVFFVISGFIMVYTHWSDFKKQGSTLRFISKRLIRIVPMYWLATALAITLVTTHLWHLQKIVTPETIIKSFFFIPYSEDNKVIRPILGPGWTLIYEMMFYAFFSICLFFRRRVGITLLIATLGSWVIFARVLAFSAWDADPVTVAAFMGSPLILLFLAGAVLGSLAKITQRRWALPGLSLSVALLFISVTVFVLFVSQMPCPFSVRLAFWIADITMVALCVFSETPSSISSNSTMERLGNASFSLYLTHIFIVLALMKLLEKLRYQGALLFPVVAMVISALAAFLIYDWIERPIASALKTQRVKTA